MVRIKGMNCGKYSVRPTRLTTHNFPNCFVLCALCLVPFALWFSVWFGQLEPIVEIRGQEEKKFRVLIAPPPALLV